MNTHQPDFVSVDMRGLKAALVERALAERVSVSVVVRRAVVRELGAAEDDAQAASDARRGDASRTSTVKLSIRLTTDEAKRLVAGARSAGLSRGAYLAGLVAGVPVLTTDANRPDLLVALTASSGHLARLSHNIHALTRFLTLGNVPQALVYRDMLDTLDEDVRRHLAQASALMADLRPRTQPANAKYRPHR
jgi:hypothetical protein